MKRLSSTPISGNNKRHTKRFKTIEEPVSPNNQEYLQLVLDRIVELQRQISDGVYVADETSDLGESDSDDDTTDIMKEVLTKVFKDLPGSTKAVTTIIDSTSKPSQAQLKVIRGKSIQLSGFETCRKVAADFVKNDTVIDAYVSGNGIQRRYEVGPAEPETRKRMLVGLDLHLAAKQRDYTARLMSE